MPSRVRIEELCDPCYLDGEQEVEATHMFAVSALETRTKFPGARQVLTCDVHAKPILDLIELLAHVDVFKPEQISKSPKAAVAVAKAPQVLFDTQSHTGPTGPPSSWPVECSMCDAVPSGSSALVGHIWGKHVGIKKPAYPDKCPECGIGGMVAVTLAQHRRFEHNFDPVVHAYEMARKHPKYDA